MGRGDAPGRLKDHANDPFVLIGISDYADKQIKPRAKAEEDVKALYDLLTNKDYLGADKENVRLLLGHEDATTTLKIYAHIIP